MDWEQTHWKFIALNNEFFQTYNRFLEPPGSEFSGGLYFQWKFRSSAFLFVNLPKLGDRTVTKLRSQKTLKNAWLVTFPGGEEKTY